MNWDTNKLQAIEAEKAVLGSVFLDNDVMDQVIPKLEARDFSLYPHQILWTTLKRMNAELRPIDCLTVTHELISMSQLDGVGGVEYLSELSSAMPTSAHCSYYAGMVRQKALFRRVLEMGEKIKTLVFEDDLDEEELFRSVDNLTSSLYPSTVDKLLTPADSRVEYEEHLAKQDHLILTGFEQMDAWMGGMGRGDLYILAARPGVGKTAKMLQLLYNVATQEKGACIVYSQEMKRPKLYNRIISSLTKIPIKRFRTQSLTEEELEMVMNAYNSLEALPLHIADGKKVTIEEIHATARSVKRMHGKIAMICVDYLGIMNIPQHKGITRAQAIGEVTRAAKQIALELDCVFLMLCQMNREGMRAARPSLEHLNESGSIEADADIVEFLWEDAEDSDPGDEHFGAKVVKSIIAKGRDVGVNEFRYAFKTWIQKFEKI